MKNIQIFTSCGNVFRDLLIPYPEMQLTKSRMVTAMSAGCVDCEKASRWTLDNLVRMANGENIVMDLMLFLNDHLSPFVPESNLIKQDMPESASFPECEKAIRLPVTKMSADHILLACLGKQALERFGFPAKDRWNGMTLETIFSWFEKRNLAYLSFPGDQRQRTK